MEALILPILFKLAPYVIAGLGLVALYFGIKRKGVQEERDKARAEKARVEARLRDTAAKDAEIDEKVKGQIDEIHKTETSIPQPGDIFKF